MSISVHDNILLSYSVDAEKREICLRTRYYGPVEENTNVTFIGIVSYYFENDDLNTVIFDIEETALDTMYNSYRPDFYRLKSGSGFSLYGLDDEQLLDSLKQQSIRAYEIYSSCGLRGWVWAN